MWLISRPGSWQSSWHVPSLLDVCFSFLEVDFQTPKFILFSHETGSLPRLTIPQMFLFRISKELCHWSPELMLGNSVPFSFQLPCMGPIWLLSKLLEHSFPKYLHGCFFFLIIQFSADLLRDYSWSKKPPRATPTSPTIFIKSMKIWWKLFYFYQNSSCFLIFSFIYFLFIYGSAGFLLLCLGFL